MNIALRPAMTIEQFLAWEEQQDLRFEFDGVRPVAMTGGTEAHALIQANLIRLIGNELVGKPCRVYGSHLKVATATSIRYPDAFVVCSAFQPRSMVATEPVVVFEILSRSTVEQDLVTKNGEYRATPSVQQYIVLEQTNIGALMFRRHGDLWVSELRSGADAMLDMPEIGAFVPLGEVYAGVSFGEAVPEQAQD